MQRRKAEMQMFVMVLGAISLLVFVALFAVLSAFPLQ